MASSYEQERLATIAKNKEMLRNLMKQVDLASVNKPKPATNKRKSTEPKAPSVPTRAPSGRVSARLVAQTTKADDGDFEAESEDDDDDEDAEVDEDEEDEEDEKPKKRARRSTGGPSRPKLPLQRYNKRLTKRGRPDPKIFGEQPNSPVGKWWAMRIQASQAGVHAPTVAGISGNASLGTWSVALSGGYPEDVDFGYSFTYTGCGGRDLKGTKDNPKNLRTAPQSSDQTFDNPLNAALKTSFETGNPIRVIRGFKLPSPFAPLHGYRYDGLYVVKSAWEDVGETGFKVCRFAFVRLPGQHPLTAQEGREDEAQELIDHQCGDLDLPPIPGSKKALALGPVTEDSVEIQEMSPSKVEGPPGIEAEPNAGKAMERVSPMKALVKTTVPETNLVAPTLLPSLSADAESSSQSNSEVATPMEVTVDA